MNMEEYIRAIAGAVIVVTLVLGHVWSGWWHLLTGLAGVSLFQSAFTKVCPMRMLLTALGVGKTEPAGPGKEQAP